MNLLASMHSGAIECYYCHSLSKYLSVMKLIYILSLGKFFSVDCFSYWITRIPLADTVLTLKKE